MHYFEVTMISRTSGKMQKILVQGHDHHDMQHFVSHIADLEITDPVVTDIKLARPRN